MFLVIWNQYPLKYMPQHTQADHYAAFETLTEATERYEELIEQGVSVCSIAPVMRSTDYDAVPGMDAVETAAIARENMQ